MRLVIARMHIECYYIRERDNDIFLRRFLESQIRTTELQGAHLPFLVCLVSLMCNIEYTKFDSH
jgi:hypothetical protein